MVREERYHREVSGGLITHTATYDNCTGGVSAQSCSNANDADESAARRKGARSVFYFTPDLERLLPYIEKH